VGFEWGYRIDNRISGAILDWSSLLDPARRKLLTRYDDKPSLPMRKVKAKAEVEEIASDCDNECEFTDPSPDKKLGDTAHRKRKRDRDVVRAKRQLKSKIRKQTPTLDASSNFIDERPTKLSWNSSSQLQFAQEPSISWNHILEFHKKNNSKSDHLSTSSKQKWFGLEFAHSTKSTTNAASTILAGPTFESSEGKREEPPSIVATTDRGPSAIDDIASKVKLKARQQGSAATDSITDPMEPATRKQCWFGLELAPSPTRSVSKFQTPPASESAANEQPSSNSVQKTTSSARAVTLSEPTSPTDTKNENIIAAKTTPTKVTPRTTKAKHPTPSSARLKHPTVGPKLAKIPLEPSKDFIGWSIRHIPKKDGATYINFYSPHKGYQFRSRPEVKRFIKLMEETGSEEDAIKEFKRGDKTQTNNKAPTKETPATKDRPVKEKTEISDSFTSRNQPTVVGEGDEVYAAWWPSKARKTAPVFFAGTVKSVSIAEVGSGRLCHIKYADGDELKDIDESMVFPKDEYLHNNLKPIFDVGNKVFSAWWPGTKSKASPSWYPGIIKGKREKPRGGAYGPLVLYDILFDDGDVRSVCLSHLHLRYLSDDVLFLLLTGAFQRRRSLCIFACK
jgi:hypothetical protein